MLTRPDLLLRVEALLVLLASLIGYTALLHGHWPLLAALFLAPDVALLAYLSGKHRGPAASIYNTAHSYALPILLGLAAWNLGAAVLSQIALIWIAHIAFDRLLGFGLKYRQGFRPTHIQSAAVYQVPRPPASPSVPPEAGL